MPKTAIDPFFGGSAQDLNAPTRRSQIVTPSDTVDLSYVTKQLIVTVVGAGAAIAWLDPDQLDQSPTVIPLAAGTYIFNVQVRRIMATGTVLGGGTVVALWG